MENTASMPVHRMLLTQALCQAINERGNNNVTEQPREGERGNLEPGMVCSASERLGARIVICGGAS